MRKARFLNGSFGAFDGYWFSEARVMGRAQWAMPNCLKATSIAVCYESCVELIMVAG